MMTQERGGRAATSTHTCTYSKAHRKTTAGKKTSFSSFLPGPDRTGDRAAAARMNNPPFLHHPPPFFPPTPSSFFARAHAWKQKEGGGRRGETCSLGVAGAMRKGSGMPQCRSRRSRRERAPNHGIRDDDDDDGEVASAAEPRQQPLFSPCEPLVCESGIPHRRRALLPSLSSSPSFRRGVFFGGRGEGMSAKRGGVVIGRRMAATASKVKKRLFQSH